MKQRLERDSQLQKKAVKPDSVKFFSNLIQNEQDLVQQLEGYLSHAEQTLASLGAPVAGTPQLTSPATRTAPSPSDEKL